jgi:hypothetical protein
VGGCGRGCRLSRHARIAPTTEGGRQAKRPSMRAGRFHQHAHVPPRTVCRLGKISKLTPRHCSSFDEHCIPPAAVPPLCKETEFCPCCCVGGTTAVCCSCQRPLPSCERGGRVGKPGGKLEPREETDGIDNDTQGQRPVVIDWMDHARALCKP